MRNFLLAALAFSLSTFAATTRQQQDLRSAYANRAINGGVENGLAGWTASGGTLSRSSTKSQGEFAVSWDASSASQKLQLEIALLPGDGVRGGCRAAFKYQGGGTANITVQVEDGSANILSDAQNPLVISSAASGFTYEEVPFDCSADTANARSVFLSFVAAGDAAALLVDEGYAARDWTVGNVAQAEQIASAVWPSTASCTWTTSSTSYADFAAVTACPSPTLVSAKCTAQTSGDQPGLVCTNLAPGAYVVTAIGLLDRGGTANANAGLRISDGTTAGANVRYYPVTAEQPDIPFSVYASFNYTAPQSSVTFRMQGITSNASNSTRIDASTSSGADFSMVLAYYPTSSQTVQRADVQNVMVQAGGSPTGSLTAASPTIWGTEARDVTGSYNSSTGEFTAPLDGDYCWNAAVSIEGTEAANNSGSLAPYVNGSALTRGQGFFRVSATSLTSHQAQSNACTFLSRGQILTFRTSTSITSPSFGSGESNYLNIWNASGAVPKAFVPGSVFSPSSGIETIARAEVVCSNSATSIQSQSGTWLSAPTNGGSAGECSFTMAGFSSTPTCVCTVRASNTDRLNGCHVQTISATNIALHSSSTTTPGGTNEFVQLLCMGPK